MLSLITRTAFGLGLLLVAFAIYVALVATKPQPAESDLGGGPPRVVVMRAEPVLVQRQWSGFGTAVAMDSADVAAEVSAIIVEVPLAVVAGAEVERGALLARLDETDFQQQVDITRQGIAQIDAQLTQLEVEKTSWQRRSRLIEEETELAQRELERVRAAQKRGGANELEVDRARRSLKLNQRFEILAKEELAKVEPRRAELGARRLALEAELRLALKNVERCTIRSPIAGSLVAVDVEVGESLAAGQRVARVVSLRRVEVPLRLPASARPTIGVGDQVRLTSASAMTWSGQVARIAPVDDEMARTTTVYVEIEQDPRDPDLLAPGKFVEGTLSTRQTRKRWVVPRRAMQGDRILLIEEGRIIGRPVTVDFRIECELPRLGLPDREWVVLKEPLRTGDLVVINASRALPDGLVVQPVPATALSGGGEASK